MLRNAAVVAANIGCEAAVPKLIALAKDDPEPLIRSHALWAAVQLSPGTALVLADVVRTGDPDPRVRLEAQSLLMES
ncbi:MAG TPA: HEAT repeat domain-containing protein [Blastocatellia bacterium]